MQLDEVSVPGPPVQAVDVLRDEPRQATLGLHRGETVMGGIRLRAAHPAPAQMSPGPVALQSVRPGDELLVRHRGAHRRAWPPVVRDPGVGRHTRTGEHQPAPVAEDAAHLVEVGGIGLHVTQPRAHLPPGRGRGRRARGALG